MLLTPNEASKIEPSPFPSTFVSSTGVFGPTLQTNSCLDSWQRPKNIFGNSFTKIVGGLCGKRRVTQPIIYKSQTISSKPMPTKCRQSCLLNSVPISTVKTITSCKVLKSVHKNGEITTRVPTGSLSKDLTLCDRREELFPPTFLDIQNVNSPGTLLRDPLKQTIQYQIPEVQNVPLGIGDGKSDDIFRIKLLQPPESRKAPLSLVGHVNILPSIERTSNTSNLIVQRPTF